MKHSGGVVVLIVLLTTAHFPDVRGEAPNPADAAEVMSRVVAAYQSLSTYNDKGTAVVHLASVDYRIDFQTLFKRPGRLRFAWTVEYSETPSHRHNNVVWSDGATAWASYSFHGNKLERKEDLGVAVASAIGASWETVSTIPRLLTDEIRTVRLDELSHLRMLASERVDGIECFVVDGYFPSGGECKVWIGRSDYLIRRLEQRSETMKREEVRTQIVVNQDIPDSRFSQAG